MWSWSGPRRLDQWWGFIWSRGNALGITRKDKFEANWKVNNYLEEISSSGPEDMWWKEDITCICLGKTPNRCKCQRSLYSSCRILDTLTQVWLRGQISRWHRYHLVSVPTLRLAAKSPTSGPASPRWWWTCLDWSKMENCPSSNAHPIELPSHSTALSAMHESPREFQAECLIPWTVANACG